MPSPLVTNINGQVRVQRGNRCGEKKSYSQMSHPSLCTPKVSECICGVDEENTTVNARLLQGIRVAGLVCIHKERRVTANQYYDALRDHLYPMMKHFYFARARSLLAVPHVYSMRF